MQFVRFELNGRIQFGALDRNQVTELTGAPWHVESKRGHVVPIDSVKLLSPVEATRVFGVAYNYNARSVQKGDSRTPRIPVLFMKPSTAVIGSGEKIIYPAAGEDIHFEGELAVVIGRRSRWLTHQNALEAVFGYTCANDVSDRVMQREEGAFGCLLVGKGADTFCPLGPWIVTGLDPTNLHIETRVNGEVRQSGSTANLIFSVQDTLVYISKHITLLPGDVILSGTPDGMGPFHPGDRIEVDVEGIGTLENTVFLEQREAFAVANA